MIDTIFESVESIIEEHAELFSQTYRDKFKNRIYHDFLNYNINSPIELILLSALILIKSKTSMTEQVEIFPQFEIDKFRVDFLIRFEDKELIIECDSQEFHDRTEIERQYEKNRERFFVKKGYDIFRYTGKEIKENSIKIATEIITFLTGIDENDLF